jgi:hypothetical protein
MCRLSSSSASSPEPFGEFQFYSPRGGGFVMGRPLRTKSLSETLFEFSQVRENA